MYIVALWRSVFTLPALRNGAVIHYVSTGCLNAERVSGEEVAVGNSISVICIKSEHLPTNGRKYSFPSTTLEFHSFASFF